MENPSSPPARNTRILWGIVAALALVALALNGYKVLQGSPLEWGRILSPLGLLIWALGSLLDPRRGLLYRVLFGIALVMLVLALVLALTT